MIQIKGVASISAYRLSQDQETIKGPAMRHAIILAHPDSGSFCASIARDCMRVLRSLGHSVLLRDLYSMDFQPCLQAEEIPGHPRYAPAPDVVAERDRLAEVDSFILVYPFWFNAPPAILKGFVDRVFGLGFGYSSVLGGTAPMLAGRTLTSFSTSGAPEAWVDSTGALKALMTVFDLHLAAVTGLDIQGHTHLGGITPSLGPDPARAKLLKVDAALRSTFGKPPQTARPGSNGQRASAGLAAHP
jgi:NAD(P)H dehydrogenase (quinone)